MFFALRVLRQEDAYFLKMQQGLEVWKHLKFCQVNFPYIDVGQADFNKARASDVMSKGCSLGQVLSILGAGYSLLSWSYDKDMERIECNCQMC